MKKLTSKQSGIHSIFPIKKRIFIFHNAKLFNKTTSFNNSLSRKNYCEWKQPKGKETGIKVKNSLTNTKTPLILKEEHLTWYSCGPTVYDDSHIGHARNYISIDLLQRILSNHFKIRVFHLMGVTDVDDKIINRAKETGKDAPQLAKHFEQSFFKDLASLNIKLPNAILRVSEHIEEIIQFIQQIEKNGFAYVSNGSVYFDSEAFKKQGTSKLISNEIEEGQETQISQVVEKKNPQDFALWKKVEETGYGWNSPWGFGRPGWHIECSAMICSILGDHLCIHAGGIDLKFPHHNNEILQCEAHFSPHSQWVDYFVHVGHLHIVGRKMSKSLKNFITISDLLQSHSANHFRIFCISHKYNSNIEFSADRMTDAVKIETRFVNFLESVSQLNKLYAQTDQAVKWTEKEKKLNFAFNESQILIDKQLADDFDTPAVLNTLLQLISETNSYISIFLLNQKLNSPNLLLIDSIAQFVSKFCEDVFGIEIQKEGKKEVEKGGNEKEVEKLVNVVIEFRNSVRNLARKKEAPEKYFKLSDELRDKQMAELGYVLEDTPSTTIWKKSEK